MSCNRELDKDMLDLHYRDLRNSLQRYDKESEYLHMSLFFQTLFISKSGYIIGTGNFRDANYELVRRIYKNIERHPILFKLLWKYFMVA